MLQVSYPPNCLIFQILLSSQRPLTPRLCNTLLVTCPLNTHPPLPPTHPLNPPNTGPPAPIGGAGAGTQHQGILWPRYQQVAMITLPYIISHHNRTHHITSPVLPLHSHTPFVLSLMFFFFFCLHKQYILSRLCICPIAQSLFVHQRHGSHPPAGGEEPAQRHPGQLRRQYRSLRGHGENSRPYSNLDPYPN